MRHLLWLLLAAAVIAPPVWADPCGLVPPIATRTDPDRYLTREGEQITFVFFKNGIQDVVLRPAFKGKVSEFGMLIPFPSPPAIRKVADDIFAQVKDAVEPPRVKIDLSPPVRLLAMRASIASADRGVSDVNALTYRKPVRVLKEEAVGMYQVAVLEAGSAEALKKWMNAHGYIYPEGMDKPAQEYVEKEWCFVAVKARVGKKKGVQPRPGMKKTDPDLPEDAIFSGAVQAMGFRFRVEEPVVPMRLSAYNPGKLYNIVYALTDGPVRFKQLPGSLVEKQLSGEDVLANLTESLPATYSYMDHTTGQRGTLEVGRGEEPKDLPESVLKRWQVGKDQWEKQRDPIDHNGKARALFASDLLAARRGALIHSYEERQKELLNIGEELKLRGPATDELIHEQIKVWKEEALGDVLDDLKSMTLTVIKGDFPREVLRDNDLTFLAHGIPEDPIRKQDVASPWFFVLLFAATGLAAVFRRSRRAGGAVLVALLAGSFAYSAPAQDRQAELTRVALALGDSETRGKEIEALTKRGEAAVQTLHEVAWMDDADLTARGWALVCLARIDSQGSVMTLTGLAKDAQKPSLLRLWAVGALASIDSDRALTFILETLSRSSIIWTGRWPDSRYPQIEFHEALLEFVTRSLGRRHPSRLIEKCLQGKDSRIRRTAAAVLGHAELDSPSVRAAYLSAITYSPKAGTTPWNGGSLFIPGVDWTPEQRKKLIAQLEGWQKWATVRNSSSDLRILRNNLRALGQRIPLRRPFRRP